MGGKTRLPRDRVSFQTGLDRRGANSIAAQLRLDVPAPRLLPPPPPPPPLPGHRPCAARVRAAALPAAPWAHQRWWCAVGLCPGHGLMKPRGKTVPAACASRPEEALCKPVWRGKIQPDYLMNCLVD